MTALKTYLVEDSPVIRESLIATLEELVPVLVVGTAEDEASATRWLNQPANQADLVIVDIFLKSGSGLGVLKSAQARQSSRHWVVLSNYATPDMQRQCMELGAARVFDKSNDIDALMDYCAGLAEADTAASVGHSAEVTGGLPGATFKDPFDGFGTSHASGYNSYDGLNGHSGHNSHNAHNGHAGPGGSGHAARRDAGPHAVH